MLAFVVPLKSAASANSWTRISELAERTLRSACAQTHPDFRVIVACHEMPSIAFTHSRLEFVGVHTRRPASQVRDEVRRDKGNKLLAALRRALQYRPTHVMPLDADDCVSNRLAEFVAAHPAAHGWFMRKGYFWREGSFDVHVERRRFHQWCGSCNIVRPELLNLPHVDQDGWYLRHGPVAQRLRDAGTPLQPLPFPGAVYLIANGENINDYGPILWPRNPVKAMLRRLLYHRPLTPAIREEFGLGLATPP